MKGLRAAAALGFLAGCASLPAAPPPWVIPDALAAGGSSDEEAWRLFVAISWPANPASGLADPQARLGTDRPAVWETWKNGNDIFRADGADPGPWEAGPAAGTAAARFEAITAVLPHLRHIVHGRMVPLADPFAAARKLIEVRMNRTSFEHIRAHELYCLEGQLHLLAAGTPAPFPAGAIQVKASWRPLAPAQRSRYHTLEVTHADGRTVLYGLTALNIALKDRPGWLWAAFEHQDNAQRADGEGWQLPSRDSFACPGSPAGCDQAPRGIGLAGTVWEHYRLRGTLSSYVDAAGVPQLLASSELESGLQRSSSCITCHSRAAIGQAAGTHAVMRLPVFAATEPARRGYTGLPDPAWFRRADGGGATLTGLDFVWSLSRAAPRTLEQSPGDLR